MKAPSRYIQPVACGLFDGHHRLEQLQQVGDPLAALSAVNYFFPLNETVTIFTGLFSLWLAMVTYRMVKSWIPTEAS